jgi:hypothetical protein
MKNWIVRTLLRRYPADWRREYGAELTDMLLARPLTVNIVGDVLRNALWQRLRTAEISTLVGLAMMLIMLNGFVWNIVAPPRYGSESSMLLQYFWGSNLYVELLVACGLWTNLRYRGELSRSGRAAMRITFLAGVPTMLAGVLMLSGFLGVIVVGRWDTPTTFHEHGFAYTYYDAPLRSCWIRVQDPTSSLKTIQLATCPPAPLGVLVAPLFTLPSSWLWGMVGGLLGRWITRGRRRPVATS